MKLGDHDVFKKGYGNKGVCSATTTCTDYAVNLWASEFLSAPVSQALSPERQDVLFRGIRHGILSPYGLRSGQARTEGAIARAKEVVIAALYMQPELLNQALASPPYGGSVRLKLTSTSLVTAMNLGSVTEGKQVEDQFAAWTALASQKPFEVVMRDKDGAKTVKVELEVAVFNFGVNEGALHLKAGWNKSDPHNEAAMHPLLGEDLSPGSEPGGGWTASSARRLSRT